MQRNSKAFDYFLVGVKIDVLIVGLLCFLLLVLSAVSFDGRCQGILFASSRQCSFQEYVGFNFTITFLIVLFFLWWAVIPALLVAPLLGLIIGHYKSQNVRESEERQIPPYTALNLNAD